MKRSILKSERGQAIAEFALLLPIIALLGFGFVDMFWAVRTTNAIEIVVTESARCEAIASGACSAPNSARSYALSIADNMRLHLDAQQLNTPPCNPNICSVTITYPYKPLGVWFPAITISRTGTASVAPQPPSVP